MQVQRLQTSQEGLARLPTLRFRAGREGNLGTSENPVMIMIIIQ